MKLAILSACLASVIASIFGVYLYVTAQQRQGASEFMSNLAKCGNCNISRPFIGPGSALDKSSQETTNGH
jgi:hypothetical protein